MKRRVFSMRFTEVEIFNQSRKFMQCCSYELTKVIRTESKKKSVLLVYGQEKQ